MHFSSVASRLTAFLDINLLFCRLPVSIFFLNYLYLPAVQQPHAGPNVSGYTKSQSTEAVSYPAAHPSQHHRYTTEQHDSNHYRNPTDSQGFY